ncbi:hypothetical protein ASPACDRAFT_77891 [Aspergillus aculeatus ATCC 16872]|uniref:Selenoprotein W-like protein n=1 Tax=Aspergillus aculeatus (strain ATCC 16872 / CBS 172.66 / WB 5094) TaxID=690307 RepID=A0A1L9WY40_ASPA1|nr:uncharacterized protein ASPACDRAFT_77891 [Aspergillus aculeatus ATCC 16872]OJK01039.1 hypothetical protein ASPACDRAFT_77891 [Aspergillus aculeatus ATCC 16872]
MISLPQHTPTPNASSVPQDQLTTAANPTATPDSAPQQQHHHHQGQQLHLHHPRLTIQYCTQCKWMLRAAYFAQELLSTFSTQLGEVALQPATGGVFTVTLYHRRGWAGEEAEGNGQADTITETVLWDRKRDGGFPEVKVLKSLVRNVVDPGRDLGHTDRALRKARELGQEQQQEETQEKEKCEECQ